MTFTSLRSPSFQTAYSVTLYDTIQFSNIESIEVNLNGETVFSMDATNTTALDTLFAFIEGPDYTIVETVYDTLSYTVYDTVDITSINTIDLNGLRMELTNNPVYETLSLQIENKTNHTMANLSIYNIEGKKILSETLGLNAENSYQQNVSNLASGIYFVRLSLKDREQQTLRFVKE